MAAPPLPAATRRYPPLPRTCILGAMLYRDYGTTGARVSAIGFGGMRFEQIDDRDACVEMMLEAARGGVNYFDTAPKYFGVKSEEVYGEALAELRRNNLPYYLATKTFESTERAIRTEIEAQLKRLNVEAIDFYHVWCITTLSDWQSRQRNGVLQTMATLKEDGLIRHICVSSHLIGDEIRELLMDGLFEGVLFGYSGYNFQTRRKAFEAIRAHRLGCTIMNPLGGGIIPQHPHLFEFLKTNPEETVVEAAIAFLLAHAEISTVLVGFGNKTHVQEALRAVARFDPSRSAQLERIMAGAGAGFEGLCTGCQYCDHCPEGIAIPRLMDAYNHKLLLGDSKKALNRLKYHWELTPANAAACIACGICEGLCTQHLPIIERLAELAELG